MQREKNRGKKVHNNKTSKNCAALKNSVVKEGDIGDAGSIPGSGRSPGEGNGNPLQYSCLENPVDRGALWATVHRVRHESDMTDTTEQAFTDIHKCWNC